MTNVTLHHPILPSTVEVDEGSVPEWTNQGWLKSTPKAVREKADDSE